MKLERLFSGFNISALGLSAQRKRMNALASNMANAETTRTEAGGPYKRKIVLLQANTQQVFAKVLRAAGFSTVGQSGLQLATTQAGHLSGNSGELEQQESAAVGVTAIEKEDNSPFKMVYDPSHPDADAEGFVRMPNVNIVTEMVEMISASRAYEANVTAINAAKNMARDSLEI